MKDFDAGRQRSDAPLSDRQFQMRGRTFTIRASVPPEAAALIEDASLAGSSIATLKQIDEAICMWLIPEDRAAWTELRRVYGDDGELVDTDDPPLLEDMLDVSEWLLQVSARRPTRAPSASTDGRAAENGSSTAPSSSPEATQTA